MKYIMPRTSKTVARKWPVVSAAVLACTTLWSPFATRSACASPLTTQPYSPDVLTRSSWPARIDFALRETGSVDAIADQLGTEPSRDPVVLRARYRVAIERGELENARAIASQLLGINPADLKSAVDESQLEQMLGDTTAAIKTLKAGIAASAEPEQATPLRLRLAILFFDGSQSDAAIQQLDECVKADPSASSRAGIIAMVFGKLDVASRYLTGASQKDPSMGLLEANAALDADHTDRAKAVFTECLQRADLPQDKRYIQERLIATARRDGSLNKLADAWLADDKLPAERVVALLSVLRELDRTPELLAWWYRAAETPAFAETVLSPRVVQEVIGAAQSARLSDDAEKIALKLLELHPDSQQWLAINLQLLLPDKKVEAADALLKSQIVRFSNAPVQLQQVGALAESFGRSAVAVEAAKRLQALGGDNAIAGQLLEAAVLFDTGKPKEGSAVLNEAADAASTHPEAASDVADAFEDAGQRDQAIKILKQRFQQQPDLGIAERLASLLMLQDRSVEAVPFLDYLRLHAASAGLKTQARQHIVEIATTGGTLDQLIERTRVLVNSPAATADDVILLVDAYVAAKNGAAADNLLQTTKLLMPAERRQQRVLLFERLGDLNAADSALRQVLEAEPANAAQTLQQISALAMRRGKPAEAAAAISQLQAQMGESAASLEMLATLNDGLGQPLQAARCYRRAIATSNEDSEDWLLWATALAKAGRKDLAEHRLEALTAEATNDDTFAVAVDGLLNLRVSDTALRAARREAIFKVAESPKNMTCCNLVSDLSDELGDNGMSLAVMKIEIAMNRDERPELLRQLLESAGQKGMVDTAIDAGRSLLSLGYDFPPQLFQELGEQLLIARREQDATRAFDRADQVSLDDITGSVTRAAKLFQDYGYYDQAIAELNRVEGQRNTDPDYHEALADLDERTGRPDAAFAQYMISIRQIAAKVLEASDQPAPRKKAGSPVTAGSNFAISVGGTQDKSGLSQLVLSACATARRPEQQTELLQDLARYVRDLMQRTRSMPQFPESLSTALSALRHASFCLHQPDFADQADREALKRWPNSARLKDTALTERIRQGLYVNASHFAAEMGLPLPPAILLASEAMQGSSPTTFPAAPDLTGEIATLPAMIALGDLDQAKDALNAILPQADRLTPDQFATAITGAGALGSTGSAEQLALQWAKRMSAAHRPRIAPPRRMMPHVPMSPGQPAQGPPMRTTRSIRPTGGGMRQTPLQRAVATSWRFLSAAGRDKLLQQLVVASLAPDGRLSDAPMAALQIAASSGSPLPDCAKIADAVIARDGFDVETAVQLFGLLPANNRPSYIDHAIQHLPKDQVLRFLIEIVAQTTDPFDQETARTISAAADHLSIGQDFEWSNWFANLAQRAVLPVIARAVIRNGDGLPLPQDAASRAAAALALSNSGCPALADQTALEAIRALDKLQSLPTDANEVNSLSQFLKVSFYGEWFNQACLRIAVGGMSEKARDALFTATTDEQVGAPSSTGRLQKKSPWTVLKQAVLTGANGQRENALKLLRTGFAQDDLYQDLDIVYMDRLQSDGRLAEIVDAFSKPAMLAGDPAFAADLRRAVGQTLFLLYRPNEVHRFSKDTVGNPIDIPTNLFTLAASNDPRKLEEVFRSEVLNMLHGSSSLLQTSLTPPSVEGLDGAISQWQMQNPAIVADIATWPGCIEDLEAELRPYPDPNAFGSDSALKAVQKLLAQALVAAGPRAPVVQSLMQSFESHVKAGTMNDKDRYTLHTLALAPGMSISRDLLDDLANAALADATGTSFCPLQDVLQAQHDPRAAVVGKWAAAQAKLPDAPHMAFDSQPLGDSANQPANSDPAPAEAIDDEGLAKALGLLLDKGDLVDVESRLALLRSSGRITPDNIHCGLLWARLAAERGDMSEFGSRIRQVLLTWSAQATGPLFAARVFRPVFDIRQCLPSVCSDSKKCRLLSKAVEDAILEQHKIQPNDIDLTRMLATLGDWSVHHRDSQSPAEILSRVTEVADQQGDGEQKLWVADLARELDHPEQSIEIERRLLEHKCLPPARTATLIRRLREANDGKSADSLLHNAEAYCADPSFR